MRLKWAVACVFLLMAATAVDAKDYSARQFDVNIRVLDRGTLDITETIVFQFDEGTFSFVYRELPQRRTDGIEILSASMDGREFPFGKGTNQVEVTYKSRMRVRWRFPPTGSSTHVFVLRYLARGVVARDGDSDVLSWRALPHEHPYRIASSIIDVQLPAPLLHPASVRSRRGQAPIVDSQPGLLRVTTRELRSNGSVDVHLRFPAGAVITHPPEWQQRQLRAAARSSRWFIAAAATVAICIVLLFAFRQNYDRPPRELSSPVTAVSAPDDLPPAVAGALATNGDPRVEHAIAALISLADRGEIAITAEPRGVFGQRQFAIARPRGAAPLTGYEQAVVDTVFAGRDGLKESVTLSSARSRLATRAGRVKRAMEHHLRERGLLDDARKSVRDRYAYFGVFLLLLATAALIAAIIIRHEHGPWPLAVPGALMIGAIAAFICHHATTPLSNEGLRRANAWRAYRRHLRSLARERIAITPANLPHALPFAVAFGLAAAWAKYAERIPGAIPRWFHTATADDGAFATFIASAGAGSAGGGSSAAGGGTSGAG